MKVRIGMRRTIEFAHFMPYHDYPTHGHTSVVEVVLEGELGEKGTVMDFDDLEKILDSVLSKYNYSLLNEYFDNPTVENLALAIFRELESKIGDKAKLVSVRVHEGSDRFAEIRSD